MRKKTARISSPVAAVGRCLTPSHHRSALPTASSLRLALGATLMVSGVLVSACAKKSDSVKDDERRPATSASANANTDSNTNGNANGKSNGNANSNSNANGNSAGGTGTGADDESDPAGACSASVHAPDKHLAPSPDNMFLGGMVAPVTAKPAPSPMPSAPPTAIAPKSATSKTGATSAKKYE